MSACSSKDLSEEIKTKAETHLSMNDSTSNATKEKVEYSKGDDGKYFYRTTLKGDQAIVDVNFTYDEEGMLKGYFITAKDIDKNNLLESQKIVDDLWLLLSVTKELEMPVSLSSDITLWSANSSTTISEKSNTDGFNISYNYISPSYKVEGTSNVMQLKKPFHQENMNYNVLDQNLVSKGSIMAAVSKE